jgi:hypothetical protein
MIYHVSPVSIPEITEDGLFGHGLFFASYECKAGKFTYSLELSELKVISAKSLCYHIDGAADTDVKAFAEKFGLDVDTAFDAICERGVCLYDFLSPDDACEAGFEIQRLALVLAEKLGFDAVELEDENGGVWLVNGYIAQEKWQLNVADAADAI